MGSAFSGRIGFLMQLTFISSTTVNLYYDDQNHYGLLPAMWSIVKILKDAVL
jgi:hypothetical protein